MRRSSSSRKASAGKPKPRPFGLDSQALLAKIDSLDWEDPTIQPQAGPAATASEPPPTKRTLLFPFVAGFIVLLVGMIALRYLNTDQTASTAPTVIAAAPSEAPPPAVPTPAPAEPTDQAPASEQPTSLAPAEQAERAKLEEARRHRAELRRKALAAKQALAEKNRLERAEQERLRAERAAAEARAKAAAVAAAPKGPSSPQEVCAGEQGAFAVSACEARTCAQAQWRSHPFCIKRWQNELRKLSPSSFGG